MPPDRLLVETDSPFLTPVPHRGSPNEPARVPLVGATIAQVRGVATAEVAALTTANARRAFAGLTRTRRFEPAVTTVRSCGKGGELPTRREPGDAHFEAEA